MPDAGTLNKQITLQHASITKDTYGEESKTWVDAFTVWAALAEIGSRELYQAQKIISESTAVFKARYTARINNRQRIKYGARLFEILGVTPDSKFTELTIIAKEAF